MTDGTAKDRIRMTVAEARALGEAAMRGAGYRRRGRAHPDGPRVGRGTLRLRIFRPAETSECRRLPRNFRQPRQPVTVVRETGGDGHARRRQQHRHDRGLSCRPKRPSNARRRTGFAIVCLANTWMTGRSAYYCEMIARAGLVVIHTVASPPTVAPFGGTRPALGTNPIAFGFPTDSDPLVIDMGTSAFMGTDLQFRARLGTPIPAGVALGPDGQPTTDASAAHEARCCRSAARRVATRASALRWPWTRSAR